LPLAVAKITNVSKKHKYCGGFSAVAISQNGETTTAAATMACCGGGMATPLRQFHRPFSAFPPCGFGATATALYNNVGMLKAKKHRKNLAKSLHERRRCNILAVSY